MKLKRYNDFIKESFGTSKQYSDFLTSKAVSTDLFNDSLFDVKQLVVSIALLAQTTFVAVLAYTEAEETLAQIGAVPVPCV